MTDENEDDAFRDFESSCSQSNPQSFPQSLCFGEKTSSRKHEGKLRTFLCSSSAALVSPSFASLVSRLIATSVSGKRGRVCLSALRSSCLLLSSLVLSRLQDARPAVCVCRRHRRRCRSSFLSPSIRADPVKEDEERAWIPRTTADS